MISQEQILSDLGAFSDLGTAPSIIDQGSSMVEVEWTQPGGNTRRITVSGLNSKRVSVSLDDQPTMSYAEFLASPAMGDLGRLATKITKLRGLTKVKHARELRSGKRVYPIDWYVDPRLSGDVSDSHAEGLALERLFSFADSETKDATQLLFIMAEAGQGKSSVLEEFTFRQADRFLRGDARSVALYIDAQGRGLARLDEVIARQLNDLQFLLGYNALVALVRAGLVVLVIDGFDELIGGRGTYDDAFRSLTSFLEVLDGSGSLIAAGRSTYFVQEYESRGQLLSDDLRYDFSQVFLKPWTQADQDRFLVNALDEVGAVGHQRDEVSRAFREFQEDDQLFELLRRPLFSRDVFLLLLEGGRKPAELTADQLVPYLAFQYLQREASEKLRTTDGSILEVGQLLEYYRELAEQMWSLETREIDVADAEEIMETYAEASWGLTGEAFELAKARAGKLPFLATGETSRRVAFEHEIFFGYFLAASLEKALEGSRTGIALLGRGRLDSLTADMVAQLADDDAQVVLDSLTALSGVRHPRQVQIELNVGALVAAVLRLASRRGLGRGLRIVGTSLVGEVLAGVTLNECQFSNVVFDTVDLRGAQFVACSAVDCHLDSILIDTRSTRLELAGINPAREVRGIRYEDRGLLETTYDPARTVELLHQVGLIVESQGPRFEVRADVLDRLDRIVRAFAHANPIGTSHDRYGTLFTDDLGRALTDALIEHGQIVVDRPKQTQGPAQTFFRKRFDAAELMGALTSDSSSPHLESLWSSLSRLDL